MVIDRENVKRTVEVFYQGPFKVFTVNSEDNETFCRDKKGVFVSLGLTTSLETITEIKDILNKVPGVKARVAELKSSRLYGQFLNSITEREESGVKPYVLDYPDNSYDRAASEALVKSLTDSCKDSDTQDIGKVIKDIQKIRELQNLLDEGDGWKNSVIFKNEAGDYKIFYKTSNYYPLNDEKESSYRIGIYVEED